METLTRKHVTGPLHGGKNHGIYSSKRKGNEYAMDLWGKPLPFNCTQAPYYEPKDKNERAKGKQIVTRWPHTGEFFSKMTYAPEAYEDGTKKNTNRKYGFGTGRPLNRDDLSSTIEVGRFRHHLLLEAKQGKNNEATLMAEAAQLRKTLGTNSSSSSSVPTSGLASMLPRYTSQFDRERAVPEFNTRKLPLARKYERNYGPVRSTSSEIGEGCFDKQLLHAPEHGVGDFTMTFASRFAHPTVFGSKVFAQ